MLETEFEKFVKRELARLLEDMNNGRTEHNPELNLEVRRLLFSQFQESTVA